MISMYDKLDYYFWFYEDFSRVPKVLKHITTNNVIVKSMLEIDLRKENIFKRIFKKICH